MCNGISIPNKLIEVEQDHNVLNALTRRWATDHLGDVKILVKAQKAAFKNNISNILQINNNKQKSILQITVKYLNLKHYM